MQHAIDMKKTISPMPDRYDKGHEMFHENLGKTRKKFLEVEENMRFHLELRITEWEKEKEEEKEEMEQFMLDDKNIAGVMKSREGLSLCGVDGISFGILKG
jgi:Tfp pilus assembly protein PilP